MAESNKKHTPDIEYCDMTEDRIPEAAEIMTRAFLRGEPMSVCLQIPYDVELLANSGICRVSCGDRLAKIAIDRNTGAVVGVTTAFLSCKVKDDTRIFGSVPEEKLKYYKPIHALLGELEKSFADFPGYKNNPDCKIMESAKIAVHGDYAGQGIATTLADLRMELAKKAGCAFAVVEASGEYSQRLYRKLGFETLGEIKYKEFKYKGEVPFKNIDSPDTIKLMVKKV